jgi:hypothetical protein
MRAELAILTEGFLAHDIDLVHGMALDIVLQEPQFEAGIPDEYLQH